GQALDATLTEPRKTVNAKVRVTAYYEQSAKLAADRIVANATDNIVTVYGLKPGATVTLHNEEEPVVLGTGHHAGAGDADLTITPAPPLAAGDTVMVTYTEQYYRESDPTASIAYEKTDRLPVERIRADATASRITFKDIPDGAEIIVYDDLDVHIAS